MPSANHNDNNYISLDELPDVITPDQLATFLNVDRKLVYSKFGEGQIPGKRIGRIIRFSKVKILEWLGGGE